MILSERERTRQIGVHGEVVAPEWIVKLGLGNGLQRFGRNHRYWDCWGKTQAGHNGLWQIKTRVNTFCTGEPKTDGYSLFYNRDGQDPLERVRGALRFADSLNAVPHWVAVTLDVVRQLVSIHMGLIHDLRDPRIIDFKSRTDTLNCIVKDMFDPRIKPEWSNT